MNENMKLKLMLCWFLIPKYVENVYQEKIPLEEHMLISKLKFIPNSVVDKSVDIGILQKYCSGETILSIRNIVEKKRRWPSWKCAHCKKSLVRCRSICCDRCLNWCHFSCTSLVSNPNSYWFCNGCYNWQKEGTVSFLPFLLISILKFEQHCSD